MTNTPFKTIFCLHILALLLGAMLTLAFAPYEVFPFAVIAPAGLLAIWLNTSAKQAFWAGFMFGIGLFGTGVYWVFISIHTIGEVPIPLSVLITAGFVGILSLFPASVGYILNRYFPVNNTLKLLCAFPAIWVFSEWIRSWICTGFPWLFLGYSQTNSPLKGYAPLLSVYGVSLALLVTSALLVKGISAFRQKHYATLYSTLLAIIGLWTVGSLLNLIPWTQPTGQPFPVSLVQGNIAQDLKWSPEHLALSFDRYTELTAPLWGKDKLIIWPEAAIPLPLQDAKSFIDTMNAKATNEDSHLILGIPIAAANNKGFYNAIITLGRDQNVYLKRLLVPFGEYTPLSAFFARALTFMNVPMSNMLSGQLDQKPMIINNTKILSSVCYEIAFPELVRSSDKTIGLLLTITNDAWFGKSNAQAQHLQMAEMRAIELRRPLLFVSNNGITAIIGPDGNIAAAAPSHEAFVLNGTVQPMFGLTPWMTNGPDPLLIILTVLVIAALRSQSKKSRLLSNEKISTTNS